MAAAVAHHYGAAGLTRESAHYYAVAGAHARTLYANREALSHFESALALGHDDPRDIHEALGDVHALLGEYRAAVDRYESAAALTEGAHLAVIDQKLGNVYDRWGEWDMADAHYEAALQALEDADVTGRARIFADRAMAVHHRGDEAAARSHAGTALSLADEARDPVALARVHNILGILAAGEGQFVDAACHLEQSFRHAEDLEDPTTRIAALHNLALVEWRRGNPRAALTLAEDALARSVAQGDRHREAALHNTIADLLHAGGAAGESMAHLKRAVSIYSEIGVDAGAVRPEVWKLSEW
jgi:tetratricopeptide (TPR) repeat protein